MVYSRPRGLPFSNSGAIRLVLQGLVATTKLALNLQRWLSGCSRGLQVVEEEEVGGLRRDRRQREEILLYLPTGLKAFPPVLRVHRSRVRLLSPRRFPALDRCLRYRSVRLGVKAADPRLDSVVSRCRRTFSSYARAEGCRCAELQLL